jgi:hypothetical protein
MACAVGCVKAEAGGRGLSPAGAARAAAPGPWPKEGRLTDARGARGRHCQEVPEDTAPEAGAVVQPPAGDGWSLRRTPRRIRFSLTACDRGPGGDTGAPVSGRSTS